MAKTRLAMIFVVVQGNYFSLIMIQKFFANSLFLLSVFESEEIEGTFFWAIRALAVLEDRFVSEL